MKVEPSNSPTSKNFVGLNILRHALLVLILFIVCTYGHWTADHVAEVATASWDTGQAGRPLSS